MATVMVINYVNNEFLDLIMKEDGMIIYSLYYISEFMRKNKTHILIARNKDYVHKMLVYDWEGNTYDPYH